MKNLASLLKWHEVQRIISLFCYTSPSLQSWRCFCSFMEIPSTLMPVTCFSRLPDNSALCGYLLHRQSSACTYTCGKTYVFLLLRDHCTFRDTSICLPLCCKISHQFVEVTFPQNLLTCLTRMSVQSQKHCFPFLIPFPTSEFIPIIFFLSPSHQWSPSLSSSFCLSSIHSPLGEICKWTLILI